MTSMQATNETLRLRSPSAKRGRSTPWCFQDDAKGELSVTAFRMDQSGVMPPQPGAPQPRAPFDPGRFSVDQITLSELEERSGLDFGMLKDFDVLAAQTVPESLLRGARLRLPLTSAREAVLWAP